jgi:hypothetical protein
MSTSLDTLSNQDLCARSLSLLPLFGRSDLTHHQNACTTKTPDNLSGHVPEQSDHRDTKLNAHDQLLFEQLAIGRSRNEVDPEWLRSEAPNGVSLSAHQACRLTNHAEESESPSLSYSRHELRTGYTTHSGQHHRILASK